MEKNKKKIIKITESQLKRLIESTINDQKDKVIKENESVGAGLQGFGTTMEEELNLQQEEHPERELKRKETGFRRGDFEPYPAENKLRSLFGPYADDVPPQVYQHLRKNPDDLIKKFIQIYGKDRVKRSIGSQYSMF